MKSPRRYQLKKEALHVLQKGHPWIFRSHLSTAAEVFKTGDLLSLVDSHNSTVGFGLYDAEGLIGIRVLKTGEGEPNLAWIKNTVQKALKLRENVRRYSSAFRAIHGENDGLPGIVVDVYGDTAVLQTYSDAVDVLGRYVAQILEKELALKNVLWKIPSKRKGAKNRTSRVLFGKMPGKISFNEGKLKLTVDIGEGQKSGTFLDLRGLRKWLASQKLSNMKVLNLFSYTGTLGLAAEVGGASKITNVDISKGALQFSRENHVLNAKKQEYLEADIFKWVQSLNPGDMYDVIIVDPPNMASKIEQVPVALRAYEQIYKAVVPHLNKGGYLVACCCTSRIPRSKFEGLVERWMGARLRLLKNLQPEDDHPVGFPEGDYLKILVYR